MIFNIKNKNKENLRLLSESSAGFIFLEVIIAVALVSIVFVTLLGIGFLSLNISALLQQESQADSLVKEELEAIRAFRDETVDSWDTTGLGSLDTGVAYHLAKSGDPLAWSVETGSETIGIFTRQVVFDSVLRDSNNNIVESGGTDDPDTKKVTVTVAWLAGAATTTTQMSTYITNLFGN